MRFEHEDMSLWYGTPDTPATMGEVASGLELTLTVAVQPVSASNQVEVRYRLNQQGPVERILADWLRTDTYEGTYYFRARLPVLAPGTFVEYSAVCFCAGRQVPAPDQAQHLPGSCRISDVETVEAIDHTNATAASNCDPAGLLVPIDVSALCVGTVDAQQSTNGFAGATNVYTHQTTDDSPAFIGANVNRSFSDPPWQQLEQGIHLHWALPDGGNRTIGANCPGFIVV